MYPIVGTRYTDITPGAEYDLCEAEYQKLSDKEKQRFRAITVAEDYFEPDAST